MLNLIFPLTPIKLFIERNKQMANSSQQQPNKAKDALSKIGLGKYYNQISQSPTLLNQLNKHLNTTRNGKTAEIREVFTRDGQSTDRMNGFIYGERDFWHDYGNIYIAKRDKNGNKIPDHDRVDALIHELGHTFFLEETSKADLDKYPNQSMKEFVQNAMYAEGLAEYFKNKVYSELSEDFRKEAGFEISPNYDPNKSIEENARQLAKEYAEKTAGSPEGLPYKYQYPYEWLKKKGLLPDGSENWDTQQWEKFFKQNYKLFAYDLTEDIKDWIKKAQDWIGDKFGDWFDKINRSGFFHFYDPLVLDLDGDGIELVKANAWNGVQFDYNGDGIQSATGWVKADDGILVYDRNNNGIIDDGSEIFGTDFYHLQNIIDGFSALSTLDSNKDNVINNQDIAFNQLKVWRDFNQDGTTQTGELFTLDELDIASLSLDTGKTKDTTAKNAVGKTASYTKTDGKQYKMGDVNFEIDSVHSEYKEHIELTEEQLNLPNLHGVGLVRDLREAAALSSELTRLIKAYQAASTKQQQQALLPDLMHEWARTSPNYTDNPPIVSEGVIIAVPGSGSTGVTAGTSGGAFVFDFQSWIVLKLTPIIDAFLGTKSDELYYYGKRSVENMIVDIQATYNKISESLYNGLLMQTRLKDYADALSLTIDNNGNLALDYTAVTALFKQTYSKDRQKAFVDLAEFLTIGEYGDWTDGVKLLRQYTETARSQGVLGDYNALLSKDTIALLDKNKGTDSNDTIQTLNVTNSKTTTLYGYGGNDTLIGNNTNDTLYGGDGNDKLLGGAGNDTLNGGNGNDTLNGGAGNDYLRGDAGNDVYVLGADFGQDTINNYDNGANRKDIIRFTDDRKVSDFTFTRQNSHLIIKAKNGEDKITVQNYFNNDGKGAYRIDEIQFKDGTKLSVDTVKEMVQQGTSGNDTLYAYAVGNTLNGKNGNDTLHGAAGVDKLYGGNGADTLNGNDGNDYLNGGNDNDTLNGGNGNDNLLGGAGNDKLYSGNGNDILNGGAGNDYLSGGYGNDVYLFDANFGQDTINNYDTTEKRKDVIRFTDNRKVSDFTFTRSGTNLIIKAKTGDDKLTVQNHFNSNYRIDELQFKNGTKLTTAHIDAIIADPTLAATEASLQKMINAMASFGSGSSTALIASNTDNSLNPNNYLTGSGAA